MVTLGLMILVYCAAIALGRKVHRMTIGVYLALLLLAIAQTLILSHELFTIEIPHPE